MSALAWTDGPDGRLCAREQAKAWALREVWQEQGNATYGLLPFVSCRVRKTKNGKPTGDHPTEAALHQFFEKVDADPDWYPGKHNGETRGPKRLLRGPKQTAIASAAKRLKAQGDEPTYSAIVAACPQATKNPDTGEPVDKKLVYAVFFFFREACYDEGAPDPWGHRARLSRVALDAAAQERRWAFAKYMRTLKHRPDGDV